VGFDKDHFVGLPIPASALTIASFTLNYYDKSIALLDDVAADYLPWMVVVLSVLMVSKVKYDTLPKISRRAIRKEPWKYVFGVLAIVVVSVTGGSAIFPLFVLFIALGLFRYCVSVIKRIGASHTKFEEEESVEPNRIDI
jgi:CDP-diacylglycerol--serine O-phosphatidyltransferase